jgi:hypothetical protein
MKSLKSVFLLTLFVLPLVIVVPAFSQDAGGSDNQKLNTQAYVELLKTDANAKREAVITYILQLSDADAKVFEPIYREYDKELAKLNAAQAQALQEYAKDYQNITDKQADELVSKSLEVEAQRVELKKKYFEKMKSALSAGTAATFFEVENQLQDIVDLQASSVLPASQ